MAPLARIRSKINMSEVEMHSKELMTNRTNSSTGAVLPISQPHSPMKSINLSGWHLQIFKAKTIIVMFLVVAVLAASVALIVVLTAPRQAPTIQCSTVEPNTAFADDFQKFDPCSWSHDIGDGSDYGSYMKGWGNGELQCYTEASVDVIPNPEQPEDGVLRITSLRTYNYRTCVNRFAYSGATQWTSGKIVTKGKLAWQPLVSNVTGECMPVVAESKIKVPYKMGRWSAFWMLPEPQLDVPFPRCPTSQQAGSYWPVECGKAGLWPRSGEIDIMEHINKNNKVIGTVHFSSAFNTTWAQHDMNGAELVMPTGALQGWNVYRIVWGCDSIRWYANGIQVHEINRAEFKYWPFDQPFFLILNTAVGGTLAGPEVDNSDAEMLVDYVKVYYQA